MNAFVDDIVLESTEKKKNGKLEHGDEVWEHITFVQRKLKESVWNASLARDTQILV